MELIKHHLEGCRHYMSWTHRKGFQGDVMKIARVQHCWLCSHHEPKCLPPRLSSAPHSATLQAKTTGADLWSHNLTHPLTRAPTHRAHALQLRVVLHALFKGCGTCPSPRTQPLNTHAPTHRAHSLQLRVVLHAAQQDTLRHHLNTGGGANLVGGGQRGQQEGGTLGTAHGWLQQ